MRILALLLSAIPCAALAAELPKYPPLPILGPTALTADAGDGRIYLRWNLQLEDQRVIGWKVLQLAPARADLTPAALREPAFVARNLKNGVEYTFAVTGVLSNGGATPRSNRVLVTPHPVGEARVAASGNQRRPAIRITFPDGQELAYDNSRPVDWKTRDGEHLLYSKPFGNGLDIGQFDPRGLAKIIPPEGLKDDLLPGGIYKDVQYGTPHPHITDPLTVPFDRVPGDTGIRWQPPVVDGDRATVEYWIPMTVFGYTAWTYVRVWETWWPIERDRHGAKYHGLARSVEVEMPSAMKHGYQVMLNNGFGPGGTRNGVVSYSSGFRKPGHEVVDFSGARDRRVSFQSPKPPRQGGGYHASQDSLQSSPMIFYDWGKGGLTISARSLYYYCANNSASYIEEGADGVWPNLAWDMAIAGRRTAVDTVEYLYTAGVAQPLPQRYVNARFEIYGDVSRRMGVQDAVAGTVMEQYHIKPDPERNPLGPMVDRIVEQKKGSGIDDVGFFETIWNVAFYAVDPAYRRDETYGLNPRIKAAADKLRAAGIRPGFWFRPEVVKTSIVSVLSDKMPDAKYDWFYNGGKYPDLVKLLSERGVPIVRNNPGWIRRQRDGAWPTKTPYNWVEMSMAGGWWEQVVWPALAMSRKLGYDWLLMDGGFGGMQGVDYAPMLEGKSSGAVACQPYWWRMFRSMHSIGMDNIGECTLGWKGADVTNTGDGDEYFIWMFNQGTIYENPRLTSPEQAHMLFQLYNNQQRNNSNPVGNDAVRRFAQKFYKSHPAPDWIEFQDLRRGDPVTKTFQVGNSPVAGAATRVANQLTETVTPWTWSDVVWRYNNGQSVIFPAFGSVDWTRQ